MRKPPTKKLLAEADLVSILFGLVVLVALFVVPLLFVGDANASEFTPKASYQQEEVVQVNYPPRTYKPGDCFVSLPGRPELYFNLKATDRIELDGKTVIVTSISNRDAFRKAKSYNSQAAAYESYIFLINASNMCK